MVYRVMDRKGYGRDIKYLFIKLFKGYRRYFSGDVLNSDGRRIFEEILRMLLYEHPEHRRLVYRARRDPCLKNVVRVAELVMSREEIEEILNTVINGFYKYRGDPQRFPISLS